MEKAAERFDVVAIDSFQELGENPERFGELRKKFPSTIFVVVFQQNSRGETRGGVRSDFDSPVILKVHRIDKSFVNNYVEAIKNRGNKIDWLYYFVQKQIKQPPPRPGARTGFKRPKGPGKETTQVNLSQALEAA